MFDTEEFIIAVFCCVDDFLKQITQGRPIRQRGFAPSLTDSEVITMEIVGEFRGLDTDRDIWKYFRDHWLQFFPNLPSRFTLARQGANLWEYKPRQRAEISFIFGSFPRSDSLFLMDFRFPYVVSLVPIVVVCFKTSRITVTVQLKIRFIMGFGVI